MFERGATSPASEAAANLARMRTAVRMGRLGDTLPRVVRRIATAVSRLVARVRRLSPEQWYWVGMGLLFALFVVLLVTQATSTGRGGR